MHPRWLASGLVPIFLCLACQGADDVGVAREPNIFGEDDRMEWYAFTDPAIQDLTARSVGAWIPEERVDTTDPTNVQIGTRGTHRMVHDLCPGEAFEDQPVSAQCTGVIIDTDLVATAGHCFDEPTDCQNLRFVTNWFYESPGTFRQLTQENVYSCREVVVQRLESGMIDHAIIRLDRRISRAHRPAPVTYRIDDIPIDTPVLVPGHGAGLPLKIDGGGRVVSTNALFFETTADTFGGSSGAGVFDMSGRMLGIHVRGPEDYVPGPDMTCNVDNRLTDDAGRTSGGDASHVAMALNQLCADPEATSPLCVGTSADTICRQACDCPAGTNCEVQDNNITCVTRCSDDTDCVDGFTCEAGRCRAGPGCFAGDVWDRDVCSRPVAVNTECGAQEICEGGACVPAPVGDTCMLAEDLIATNRFIPVDIVNDSGYRDVYQGSCGAFGPDRVWRLTIDETVDLQVSARHPGYRIYIRGGDCEDAASEIACSLDTNRPNLEVTLDPGVYYVFLDAQLFTAMETTIDFIFGGLEEPDAGLADAGPPVDGGPGMDDGGCGCRVGAQRSPALPAAFAGLLGLALLRRRRR